MRQEVPRYTICEILREIYQESDKESIRLKARIAMTMAKSMVTKLPEYKIEMKDEWTGDTLDMKREISDASKKA